MIQSPIIFFRQEIAKNFILLWDQPIKILNINIISSNFFRSGPLKKAKTEQNQPGKTKKLPLLHSFAKEEVMFCR
jgi:hypothetical protein